VSETFRLKLKVSPGASRNAIQGWETGSDGARHLKIAVTAAPERGKANKATIRLLAKKLGISPSKLRLVRGDTSRIKTLEIDGNASALAGHIQQISEP